MNQYLFLYPVQEYFSSMMDFIRSFEREGHKPSELIELIDARYRNQGYGINWLLFSQEGNAEKPDLSLVPDYVNIRQEDGILVAGISFKRHCEEKRYPNPEYVLNQLPCHKRLVIGGFHQWDCVDKVAETSHPRGIDTFVDEDTTELFFGRHTFNGIPLIRKEWDIEAIGISKEDSVYEFAKKKRQQRPWLVQV